LWKSATIPSILFKCDFCVDEATLFLQKLTLIVPQETEGMRRRRQQQRMKEEEEEKSGIDSPD
jgi:hypothetical protein